MGSAWACQAIVAIFFQPVKNQQKRWVFEAVDKSSREGFGWQKPQNLNRAGLCGARILVRVHNLMLRCENRLPDVTIRQA